MAGPVDDQPTRSKPSAEAKPDQFTGFDTNAVINEIAEAISWRSNYPFSNTGGRILYDIKDEREIADPFRFVDGRFTNLVPKFQEIEGNPDSIFNVDSSLNGLWVLIKGRVLQANSGLGLLITAVSPANGIRNVILNRYPLPLVDGDRIVCIARYSGVTNYTSVKNSTLTVKVYDYGTPLPEEIAWHFALEMLEMSHRATLEKLEYLNRQAGLPTGKPLRPLTSSRDLSVQKAAMEKRQQEAQANAIAFLRKRIADGSIEAARDLANRYRKGLGVEVDEAEADRLSHWADVQEAQQTK